MFGTISTEAKTQPSVSNKLAIVALMCLVGLGLLGCDRTSPGEIFEQPPRIFIDPKEEVTSDVVAGVDSRLPLGQKQDPSPPPEDPPSLPPGGWIKPKGTLDSFSSCTEATCSCQTVTLAKIEVRDYVRTEGWGIFTEQRLIYKKQTVYQIGDASTPPESGPLRIPARDYLDQVCFFFTYPECFAYWGREGSRHPCKAVVEISYPHSIADGPNFISRWQLFGVRGVADFATGTRNVICLQVSLPGRRIPAGRGSVKWSVNDVLCPPGVPFTVF